MTSIHAEIERVLKKKDPKSKFVFVDPWMTVRIDADNVNTELFRKATSEKTLHKNEILELNKFINQYIDFELFEMGNKKSILLIVDGNIEL